VTNGNGTGVDLTGPLAGMWRDVYRKAGEVADARAREQLKYHVYTYPHGAGGDGGGGTVEPGHFVELGRAVATAGQISLRVPVTGTLPLVYGALYVVATGRANGTTARDVELIVGDTTNTYNHTTVTGQRPTGAVAAGGATTGNIRLAQAPPADAAEPHTIFALAGTLPLHFPVPGEPDWPKVGLFHSTGQRTAAAGPVVVTTAGVFQSTAAVTTVSLRCLTDGWAAGSVFIVYGMGAPASGGGTTDVTITTDASLTATESPANTFALAARLSPDAGNALSLHPNGLYSTDTGSGGGGTGNTTMYTQTGTPTGATNSLWFNPSESA
jgi:hypothetical protein